MINEIKNHSEFECTIYLDEMEAIVILIDKLLILNKDQSQSYNNDDEYIESESIEIKILSDQELNVCIKNNTIGTYHLYNELKRRSISNTNQA